MRVAEELPPEIPGQKKPSKLSGPVLVALINSVALLGAVGFLTYSRVLYKRPRLTESNERARLQMLHASPTPDPIPGSMSFDPFTVNIAGTPDAPKPAPGTSAQIQGKLHYATVGFSLELRDMRKKDAIEALRPVIMDKILSILGRKQFTEISSVQGRYVLKTQILDLVNQLTEARLSAESAGKTTAAILLKDPPITNVFFTQFTVQ